MKKILLLVALLLFVVPNVSALTLNVLTTNPAPMQAGSFADVTVEVESSTQESTYTNLDINIIESEVVQVISSTQGEFATFRPGRVATFTIRVFIAETTPEGFVDLEFFASSDQISRQEFTERVFVEEGETQPELLIGAVQTTPQELLPDTDDNELVVTVQNLGDKDAELVKAILIPDEGASASYSYSLEDTVASIASGDESEFHFTLDVAETQLESIPARLQLRYRSEIAGTNNYETSTLSLPFVIELVPAPLLEITNLEQLSGFEGGSTENKFRVTVTNNGLVEAEEVRVRLVPDISYPFIFDATTQYVSSSIQPGESATVVFVTEVTDDAQDQSYAITAKLESLVGEARYTREDTLNLQARTGGSVSNNVLAYVIIAIVIILAVIVGIRARRRK